MFFPRQNVAIARDVYLVTMEAWFPGTWSTVTASRSTKAKRRAKRAAQSRRVATDPDENECVAKDTVDTRRSAKPRKRAKRAAQSRPADQQLSFNTKVPDDRGRVTTAPDDKGRVAKDTAVTGRSYKSMRRSKRAA